MTDDRKCEFGDDKCGCLANDWDREACEFYHMPCPAIVQSKQDRLRTTRTAWEKRRDNMMRAAEKRFEKLKPGSETEEKLHEVRANPAKHLRRKGINLGSRSAR